MPAPLARAAALAALMLLALAGCVETELPDPPIALADVCRPDLRERFFALSHDEYRDDLWVVFIDVGQGDATWIRTPGTVGVDAAEILVDAGDDGRPSAPHVPDGGAAVLALMDAAGFSPGRRLDLLAVTHPDKDHYGGAAAVLDAYAVAAWLDPGRDVDAPTWRALRAAVAAEPDLRLLRPAWQTGLDGRGDRQTFDWGRDLEATLLAADADADDDNAASLVLSLRYRGVHVLLLGDAEAALEARLLADPPPPADVLRTGHHGGRGTASEAFLDAVLPADGRPRAAVISAGRRDGLPAPDTVDRLLARTGPGGLFRTDRADDGRTRREAVDGDHVLLRVAGRDGAVDLCYLLPDEAT
ncbi:MAG: MBL fold metallo-hydrolase [Myxococcales bacterium]|nr:MBL fold metallo-hydrolase [Myxococcales bacterium]